MTCDWNNVCELVHNLINEKTKVAGHVGLMDLSIQVDYGKGTTFNFGGVCPALI